jgi:phage-related baseplate assembly protein
VQRRYRVGLKLRCDPVFDSAMVLQRVEAALRADGAYDRRNLGQPVQSSALIAAVHAVPGVVAVDLDFLHLAGSAPALKTTLQAASTRAVAGTPAAAELLTLDEGPLERLELMP